VFNDIIKSDALRRGKSIRPAPATPGATPGTNSWMGSGISQPPPNMEQMLSILGQQPGMTPELLRQILEDKKNRMAVQPIMDPKAVVGGRGAGIFDYRTQL
jgi:hypothetical protein